MKFSQWYENPQKFPAMKVLWYTVLGNLKISYQYTICTVIFEGLMWGFLLFIFANDQVEEYIVTLTSF